MKSSSAQRNVMTDGVGIAGYGVDGSMSAESERRGERREWSDVNVVRIARCACSSRRRTRVVREYHVPGVIGRADHASGLARECNGRSDLRCSDAWTRDIIPRSQYAIQRDDRVVQFVSIVR